jgi:hypothetical protein
MSKNYINLKNVSYREYRPSDYAEVLSIFIKFQTEAQISTYHSYGKGQSERFYHLFLKYIFNRKLKYLFILAAKKLIKTEGRIFALLGKREKFDKYFAFIKKIFKVKVRSTSIFDKILVEFL